MKEYLPNVYNAASYAFQNYGFYIIIVIILLMFAFIYMRDTKKKTSKSTKTSSIDAEIDQLIKEIHKANKPAPPHV